MTFEHTKMCKAILEHYGLSLQLRKLVEECCELGQAAMKYDYKRNSSNKNNLLEEIADVKIMIEQISSAIDGLSHEHINEIIDYKLKRQLERIKNELQHI